MQRNVPPQVLLHGARLTRGQLTTQWLPCARTHIQHIGPCTVHKKRPGVWKVLGSSIWVWKENLKKLFQKRHFLKLLVIFTP
jgi:hypothetical protein